MPMIAVTTRWPCSSAFGSRAVTSTSGTSRRATPAAANCWATATCATAPWTTACSDPSADCSTSSRGAWAPSVSSAPSMSPFSIAVRAAASSGSASSVTSTWRAGPLGVERLLERDVVVHDADAGLVVPGVDRDLEAEHADEHQEDHDRADDEVLVPDARGDLPCGDQPHEGGAAGVAGLGAAFPGGLPHAATSCGAGTATASRNSSTRVGCCQAKWVTRPVRTAAARTDWS